MLRTRSIGHVAFETHLDLPDTLSDDDSLWRYVDLARYADLLQTSELHMARADTMEDAWEGSFSEVNVQMRPEIYKENWPMMASTMPQMYAWARRHVYMSCWHASNVESAAMWSIYDREGRGVALRSSRPRFRRAIVEPPAFVYGTTVEYVDYRSVFIPENNTMAAYRFKRSSFEHEREYRLIALWHPARRPDAASDAEGPEAFAPDDPPVSLRVAIDLPSFIDEVRVSPEAPNWVFDVVQRLTVTYGQPWRVSKSDLATGPIV